MKNTNTKEFRQLMFAYLADATDDDEGVLTCEWEFAQRIRDRFAGEFDHDHNRKRFPNEQVRIAEWLSGLPLNIAYVDGDIVDLCEEWHECTLTDKQIDKVISGWWRFMAMQVLKMWKHHNITKGNPDWYAMLSDPDEGEFIKRFRDEIAPMVIEQYGENDEPAMNEAFCNWVDALNRDGEISDYFAHNITLD